MGCEVSPYEFCMFYFTTIVDMLGGRNPGRVPLATGVETVIGFSPYLLTTDKAHRLTRQTGRSLVMKVLPGCAAHAAVQQVKPLAVAGKKIFLGKRTECRSYFCRDMATKRLESEHNLTKKKI